MGQDIYHKYKIARQIFEEAQALLDFDLIKVCFEGPLEELSRTAISQPAILTTSVALLRVFQELNTDITPHAVAGLSLGEYSALVASGSLNFKDAVKLVRKRGQFMEEASAQYPGKMLSIIGLELNVVKDICYAAKTEIANLNCPGQVVISGQRKNIDLAMKLAKEKGARKVVLLEVSGPFHSSFMKKAALSLAKELKDITILPSSFPVVSNVTANYETKPTLIKKNLIAQVDHSVNWQDSMRLLINDGVSKFFEIGPGRVLKGLMRRIEPSVFVSNIEKAQDIENLKKS
jgi:[acyl-carrier-protein] S-malonyltransferase